MHAQGYILDKSKSEREKDETQLCANPAGALASRPLGSPAALFIYDVARGSGGSSEPLASQRSVGV